MKTITQTSAPFQVVTAEPQFMGDSGYHAIISPDGGEVARVHCGDDAEAAKRMAKLMALAPQLHAALARQMDLEEHPDQFGDKVQADLAALDLLEMLRD